MSRSTLAQKHARTRLSPRATRYTLRNARVQLGDFNGHLYPDFALNPNLVYYRIGDSVGEITNMVAPPQLDLWVRIGWDRIDGEFQVLKVDARQSGGTATLPVAGYAPSSRYSWGGQDPVIITPRQFTGLRPTCNNGMIVTVGEGLLKTPAGWMYIAETEFDLTDYIPTAVDTAANVLVTLDSDGTFVVTDGDDVTPISDLFATALFTNIPEEPGGTLKSIFAARVYRKADSTAQAAVQESTTNTDLIDLRFWDAGSGGSGVIQDEGVSLTIRPKINFTGRGVTASDDSVNNRTNISIPVIREALITVSGTLSVAAGKIRIYNKMGATMVISQVFISVNTAPTGASIKVDVNKNGTTIFTTQANRPEIAASAFTGFSTTIDVTSWADGDYLTADVDQIGSTIVGADLTVHIIYS